MGCASFSMSTPGRGVTTRWAGQPESIFPTCYSATRWVRRWRRRTPGPASAGSGSIPMFPTRCETSGPAACVRVSTCAPSAACGPRRCSRSVPPYQVFTRSRSSPTSRLDVASDLSRPEEGALFEASHPFAFFDYFRTPYEVRPPTQGTSHAGAAAFVRTLTAVTRPGRAGRSLMWIGAEGRPAAKNAAGQLGRYSLDTFTFFGHVAPDAAVQAMLPGPEGRWHPAEPIRAGDDRPVAALWRDADGNVFLPFDPGEVMRLFWSEGYRDIGRSAATAFAHAAALRAYYLIRPALPRPLQLAMRRQFTRVQAASPFPGWPIEDSLHDLYGWLFATIAELAGEPVPFIGLWPSGRSWALVLTHDVETDVGYRDMDLLRGPERARG